MLQKAIFRPSRAYFLDFFDVLDDFLVDFKHKINNATKALQISFQSKIKIGHISTYNLYNTGHFIFVTCCILRLYEHQMEYIQVAVLRLHLLLFRRHLLQSSFLLYRLRFRRIYCRILYTQLHIWPLS